MEDPDCFWGLRLIRSQNFDQNAAEEIELNIQNTKGPRVDDPILLNGLKFIYREFIG